MAFEESREGLSFEGVGFDPDGDLSALAATSLPPLLQLSLGELAPARPGRGYHLRQQATAIAFYAPYLSAVLSNLRAEQAALELSGPLAPGVLRGVGKDDYVHVIMPVRTAS